MKANENRKGKYPSVGRRNASQAIDANAQDRKMNMQLFEWMR